jgi:hypothetical protein
MKRLLYILLHMVIYVSQCMFIKDEKMNDLIKHGGTMLDHIKAIHSKHESFDYDKYERLKSILSCLKNKKVRSFLHHDECERLKKIVGRVEKKNIELSLNIQLEGIISNAYCTELVMIFYSFMNHCKGCKKNSNIFFLLLPNSILNLLPKIIDFEAQEAKCFFNKEWNEIYEKPFNPSLEKDKLHKNSRSRCSSLIVKKKHEANALEVIKLLYEINNKCIDSGFEENISMIFQFLY